MGSHITLEYKVSKDMICLRLVNCFEIEFQIIGIIIWKDGPNFYSEMPQVAYEVSVPNSELLTDLSQFTSLMRMNLVLAIYTTSTTHIIKSLRTLKLGRLLELLASAIDADENDSVRYTLTDDAGGLSR